MPKDRWSSYKSCMPEACAFQLCSYSFSCCSQPSKDLDYEARLTAGYILEPARNNFAYLTHYIQPGNFYIARLVDNINIYQVSVSSNAETAFLRFLVESAKLPV